MKRFFKKTFIVFLLLFNCFYFFACTVEDLELEPLNNRDFTNGGFSYNEYKEGAALKTDTNNISNVPINTLIDGLDAKRLSGLNFQINSKAHNNFKLLRICFLITADKGVNFSIRFNYGAEDLGQVEVVLEESKEYYVKFDLYPECYIFSSQKGAEAELVITFVPDLNENTPEFMDFTQTLFKFKTLDFYAYE